MNEKELQEEVVILDKACRFAAQELANGGLNALEAHIRMANAMHAKFQRLVAETQRQQQATLTGGGGGNAGPDLMVVEGGGEAA